MSDVNKLREALEKLLEAVGSPWDVDQDCRFCGTHYEGHLEDCAWERARKALEQNTESKP